MSGYDRKQNFAKLVLLALLHIGTGSALAQATDADGTTLERTTVTTQMTRAARDRGEAGSVTEQNYPALATAGSRDIATIEKGSVSGAQSKTGAIVASSPNTDFWFYSADVVLFNDRDGDGYYHGVDLLFDADTYFDFAEVYAVAYLSLEGGPWNEYAATDVFAISGTAADDEYVIVTELVAGYPTGSYDLLIELFDAGTDAFIASFGPEDSSGLGFLALEDTGRDPARVTTTVIITEQGGGGSLSWPSLLILLLAAVQVAARHWRGSSADLGLKRARR
jgi:hypothetical protein